jgi:hypothetical protein
VTPTPQRIALLVAPLAWAMAAQAAPAPAPVVATPRQLEAVWGAPPACPALLEQINRGLRVPQPEALRAAGGQFETGECVGTDAALASQFFGLAARLGDHAAARHLALMFGCGRGVVQSYANAGAWLAGKGLSDEAIEPWDYSVGRAYTLIALALEQVQFSADAWPPGLEVGLVLEVDALQRDRVAWRLAARDATVPPALQAALSRAWQVAAVEALAQLTPVDPKYIVPARVSQPVAVRRSADGAFVRTELDPVLR